MKGILKTAGIAAIAAIFGVSTSATRAALVTTIGSPATTETGTVDGWDITTPAGVVLLIESTGNTITIEKEATFPNGASLGITFDGMANSTAASTFIVTGESIVNESGLNWTGFTDAVAAESGTATVSSVLDGGAIAAHYVLTLASNSGGVVSYTGSQLNHQTTDWGSYAGDTSTLTINASAGGVFVLDEIPTVSTSTVVPLPNAAWQGLVGLGGLALVAFGKKLKATA
jgi:hypothetical protein